MDGLEGLSLAIILTLAGASMGGAFVAAIVQLTKNVLPETWQTGRGILLIVYAYGGALVGAAMVAHPELVPDNVGAAGFLFVLSWQGIVQAAIGANQLARKGEAIIQGRTDPTGEDPPTG